MPWTRPWLRERHPVFFLTYVSTIIYHLWCGVNGLLGAGSAYSSPAFRYVNEWAKPQVWAAANLLIALALFVGLHRTNFDRIARKALAAGLLWVIFRFVLVAAAIQQGADGGNSMPNLFAVAVLHLAQTLEPPSNPTSAARRR